MAEVACRGQVQLGAAQSKAVEKPEKSVVRSVVFDFGCFLSKHWLRNPLGVCLQANLAAGIVIADKHPGTIST